MKNIWTFFENLDEMVYVSDIDNYEMIYMNKKAMRSYKITTSAEFAGKKCYEVLQHSAAPCALCNNDKLKCHHFIEWRFLNPLFNNFFLIKNTLLEQDGRRLRLEIAIDIGKEESALRIQQNLEKLVNEGLRLALRAPASDQSLEIILEYLGKAMQGHRAYIFEKNPEGNDDNTYEWAAKGITPEKDNLQNVPAAVCANWYRNFAENKNIIIKDLEDIRENDPLQYANLKRQNIHSLVVVPLYDDNHIIGFYGIDNPPIESIEGAADILQIMGHFIVSSIKRRNLMQQLTEMSYHDQLTGIGNRHAMSSYITTIQPNKSIGIIFCDITRLKWVNDNEGHSAGDKLIIQCCNLLKEVFSDYAIFRIGGDELLVICEGISQDELEKRAARLRQNIEKATFNMAVGTIWKENSTASVEKLMSEAEKLMYDDKAAYYRAHKIDRRQ